MALIAACCVVPAPAVAEPDEAPAEDLIHSDLPLFGYRTEHMYPSSFSDEADGGFGCVSRVAFGDWALRETLQDSDEEARWYRVANYGVFHCYALVGELAERGAEKADGVKPSFFIQIGKVGEDELWVLQMGGRPGSDYLLLARRPEPGIINRFTMLQRDCPRANRRDAKPIDILTTRYCAINNKQDLLWLARQMLSRKPIGTLSLVDAPVADE